MSDDDLPIRAILERIERKVDHLSGLPSTVETLTDQFLKLTAAFESLQPQLEAHREDIRDNRIKLGYLQGLGPKLDRCIILVDQLVPQMARALDRLDAAQESDAQLRESLTEIEANGQRNVGP